MVIITLNFPSSTQLPFPSTHLPFPSTQLPFLSTQLPFPTILVFQPDRITNLRLLWLSFRKLHFSGFIGVSGS